jgi:hypothetical protein
MIYLSLGDLQAWVGDSSLMRGEDYKSDETTVYVRMNRFSKKFSVTKWRLD